MLTCCFLVTDQCYWTRAFQYIKGGVPHCLGQYSDIILSTGKALNVLRLCCSNVSRIYARNSMQTPCLSLIRRIFSPPIIINPIIVLIVHVVIAYTHLVTVYPSSLQHPLCSFDYPTPTLELALSLSDLTVMETSCEVNDHHRVHSVVES